MSLLISDPSISQGLAVIGWRGVSEEVLMDQTWREQRGRREGRRREDGRIWKAGYGGGNQGAPPLLRLTWRDSCAAFPLRPRGRQTQNASKVEHSEPWP